MGQAVLPGVEDEAPKKKRGREAKPKCTFRIYAERCAEQKQPLIPANHAVHVYVNEVALPADFVKLAWWKFKDRYTHDFGYREKRYSDWPGVFLNCLKDNWLRLYWFDGATYKLTDAGRRAEDAKKRNERGLSNRHET